MDKNALQLLKAQGKSLKPFTQVGKQGITDQLVEQIKLYLKANKLGKIKFSSSILESKNETKKSIANELASKTSSILIEQVGFVVVLWKR